VYVYAAGKTTTMRMILGLDAPTQGSVTVGGRGYRDLPAPMREVGALLDAKALHGGRRARDHLLCQAQSNGIPRSRVDEVLRIVGLEGVARRRAKGLSLVFALVTFVVGEQIIRRSSLLSDSLTCSYAAYAQLPPLGSVLVHRRFGRVRQVPERAPDLVLDPDLNREQFVDHVINAYPRKHQERMTD
jgi:hypothetical protein